jgi:AmmeMemoRadiSam system protein B
VASLVRPRARMLSTTPVEIRGQQYVLLDDPEGVAPQGCAVSTPLYLVLSLCDGRRSPEDIQAAVVAEVRRFVSLAEVTQALEELERHGLLEGQRAAQRLEELTRAYRSGPREATLAGTVYPAEADALRATLEGLLAKADPSLPEGILADCLVAPHIDLGRGAAVYAEAYAAARKHVRARTFIILGVGHAACGNPLILTGQGYDTPLGPLEVDGEALAEIEAALGEEAYVGELIHANEHSIEFQAIWLKHLFPEARMVGILCSHLHEEREGSFEAADALAQRLADMMAREPERYCLVAAVDLTHVGPDFGHASPVDTAGIMRASAVDRRVMTSALAGNAQGVLDACEGSDGAEEPNVCGQAPLYIVAKAMAPCMGSVLRYGQAPTPSGTSLVGFCAAAIWRRPVE